MFKTIVQYRVHKQINKNYHGRVNIKSNNKNESTLLKHFYLINIFDLDIDC